MTQHPAIPRIQEDFKALSHFKGIRIYDLNLLGYIATDNEVYLMGNDGLKRFDLVEILDSETGKPASFSFIFRPASDEGYILPHAFDYYVREEEQQYTRRPSEIPVKAGDR